MPTMTAEEFVEWARERRDNWRESMRKHLFEHPNERDPWDSSAKWMELDIMLKEYDGELEDDE